MAKKAKSRTPSKANPALKPKPKPTAKKVLPSPSKGSRERTPAARHVPSPPTAPSPKPKKREFTKEKPLAPDESWRRIANARSPAFDQAVPAYLLDANYYFIDWNVAFDEIVAGPLGFRRRYTHAEDFIKKLDNAEAVFERARTVFHPTHVPMIDMEALVLETEQFGTIQFQKMAVQIVDKDAQLDAWSVFLNICLAEDMTKLWERLSVRLDRELNWSKYAISYDRLLLQFDDYVDLIQGIVDRLDGCHRCLDLGSGTGNGTLAMLRSDPDREVWAVEVNHSMLERLIDKIMRAQEEDECDYFSRLSPVKEDVCRLNDLPHRSFDAAILVNVLYAVDDPAACLRQVYELLAPGGRLVLSTSHVDTDVNKLFARMKEVLTKKGMFSDLQSFFVDARDRHRQMDKLIHRDTKQEIRRWLLDAGFEIVDWQDSAYAGAVVVVEAKKPD